MSYYCDISKIKDMSAVHYGVAVRRRCVRCMMTREDIIGCVLVCERPVKEVKRIESHFLEVTTIHAGSIEDVDQTGQEEATDRGEE